jgi:N4-gp56 family major capsid protein
MANAYTSTTTVSNAVLDAYDKAFEFGLRALPTYRTIADKRPVSVNNPGDSVTFSLYSDLAAATTPLTETVDPDSVAIGNPSRVSVTLEEYGNAAIMTRRLQLTSLSDVDKALANILAFNMVDSIDTLVQDALRAGSQVLRRAGGAYTYTAPGGVAGAPSSVVTTDTLTTEAVTSTVARLRAQKVLPRVGDLYRCDLHPYVAHDLRAETGSAGWVVPHEMTDAGVGNIWKGTIGTYQGAVFVENPRAYSAQDGADADGAGAGVELTRVFRTYFTGQQALAEAVNEEFHMVIGEVTDKLKRLRPVGWYGMAGWGVYRQEAVTRVETAASLQPTV